MPYKHINELPKRVRNSLPKHAQEIYMSSYNKAVEAYQNPIKIKNDVRGKKTPDTVAHKIAWTAVKNKYKKDNFGDWIEK